MQIATATPINCMLLPSMAYNTIPKQDVGSHVQQEIMPVSVLGLRLLTDFAENHDVASRLCIRAVIGFVHVWSI